MSTLKSHIDSLAVVLLLALVLVPGCKFQNLPTEEELGSYHVSVRPACQGSSTHSHRQYEGDGTSSILYYEFTCGDTKVSIRRNMLSVNGKSYGSLNDGDKITVDYGKVRVNSEVREGVSPMPW